MTVNILIKAPRAISMHIEPIMSISEYIATPNVAAKSPIPETAIDGMEVESAAVTAPFLSAPPILSVLYLVVISIA